jgi:preprotein translocase subunit Sec63
MIRWILWLVLLVLVVRAIRSLLARAVPGRPPDPVERGWDPHAVLGVPRGASREAITQAYREQLKSYHPDRVADLGSELQRLAHEKTIAIQRAYAELTKGRRER